MTKKELEELISKILKVCTDSTKNDKDKIRKIQEVIWNIQK